MATNGRFSFEQIVSARTADDPVISHDGSAVVLVVGEASKTGEHSTGNLWIWREGEENATPLTSGDHRDDAPDWSPDDRYIAFTSDRAERGKKQLYLLPLSGGEAVKITSHEGSVSDPLWSPDGSSIAYLVHEPEPEDLKKRKEDRDDAIVVDEDVRRSRIWIIDFPNGVDAARHGDVGEPRQITSGDVHIGALIKGIYSWFPDGSGFAAAVAHGPKVDYLWYPDLATISLDGTVTRLGTYPGLFVRPQVSPDSKRIAFIASGSEAPMSIGVIHVVDAGGGTPEPLAATAHGSATDVRWLPDGSGLVANMGTGLHAEAVSIDLASGEVKPLLTYPDGSQGSIVAGPSISADGTRAAVVRSDVHAGPDLWVGAAGSEARRVSRLNPWIADIPTGDTLEIEWTSSDGGTVQGLVILPVGYQEGQRYPTLIHIHGGPMGAWTNRFYGSWHDWGQIMAQRGYAVLLPNPRGSSGRGPGYLAGNRGDLGGLEWDDINTGVDKLVEMGIADEDQLVIGGWSYGGFFTNWGITHTNRFKAAVSGAGLSNWVSFAGTTDIRRIFDAYFHSESAEDASGHWKSSPLNYVRNAQTPTLILHGDADVRVPPGQSYEMYEGLKARGVETKLVIYPREPHTIGERKHQLDLLQRTVDWYDTHLGRTSPGDEPTT